MKSELICHKTICFHGCTEVLWAESASIWDFFWHSDQVSCLAASCKGKPFLSNLECIFFFYYTYSLVPVYLSKDKNIFLYIFGFLFFFFNYFIWSNMEEEVRTFVSWWRECLNWKFWKPPAQSTISASTGLLLVSKV